MAKLITSVAILQKGPKMFLKIIPRTNFLVHYIKYRPIYNYDPYCKPFVLKWILQKFKEKQFVVILNARTVFRRIL